jgi:DNA-3-methyladenine glycosylase II
MQVFVSLYFEGVHSSLRAPARHAVRLTTESRGAAPWFPMPIHLAELTPRGPFSLEAAATFGFGPNEGRPPLFDGAMRLAFAVDGGSGYAGAVLTQSEPDGPVAVELQTDADANADSALAQVARVVSLDHDGEEFVRVGERDSVLGALQAKHHGQRPVLFHSPYEAAAWAVISARRPASLAARMRTGLSEQLGHSFELAGQTAHAFPLPGALVGLDSFAELNATQVRRLRGVAAAGVELGAGHLQALGPERAFEHVQRLEGIGPFYAGLIVLRATGFADAVLGTTEPKVLRNAAELYGLEEPLTLERFTELAENWRPFRTWATVLIRLAGDRARRVA